MFICFGNVVKNIRFPKEMIALLDRFAEGVIITTTQTT